MKRFRKFAAQAVIMLLCSLIYLQAAQANDRAGFFSIDSAPTVKFDRKNLIWTLRNQAIERVIRFDAKAGNLQTVAIRDTRRGTNITPAPNSEGELTFASQVLGAPKIVDDWVLATSAPPAEWLKPDFAAANWQKASLPMQTGANTAARWYRAVLPKKEDGKAYAILIYNAFAGDAEVSFDGAAPEKVSNSGYSNPRTLQIDVPATARVVGIKVMNQAAPTSGGSFVAMAEIGSAPPTISLNKDWQYVTHALNAGDEKSVVLSISLTGLKQYEGFDVDVNYQIYAGNEPYTVKWFSFTHHRQTRFYLDESAIETWNLPGSAPNVQTFVGSGFSASDPVSNTGLILSGLSPLGKTERSADGKRVSYRASSFQLCKPNLPVETPRSVTGIYQGPTHTGAFLLQLFAAQYITRATPTSVPTAYNTWYGYQANINGAICEKIIPIAGELGAKLFVIDDGWMANEDKEAGRYGDWLVNRTEKKFPSGLYPLSQMAKQHNMRFGVWVNPTTVHPGSRIAKERPTWLLRDGRSMPVKQWGEQYGMCFTPPWSDYMGTILRPFCRENDITYLKVDGGLLDDQCTDRDHGHTPGHALAAQWSAWEQFSTTMRRNTDTFLINRSHEIGPETTGAHDLGIFGDWEIGADPRRQLDNLWWYKNADLYRRKLYDLTWTRPSFSIEFETPVHIPTASGDLKALEYHFTSVGAYICNVELHGDLTKIRPEEKALIQKWVKWNEDNRPWLAYTQPISALGKPWNPLEPNAKPHVDGVMHLRPELNKRYGYICLWNPGDAPEKVNLQLKPAEYGVRITPKTFGLTKIKNGQNVAYTHNNGVFTLEALTLEPRSWEIIELRDVEPVKAKRPAKPTKAEIEKKEKEMKEKAAKDGETRKAQPQPRNPQGSDK